MWQQLKESRLVSFLSLFTSVGTLLCCAIPSTLVLLGFGATLASFLSKFPQLIWLSEHKEIVFGSSLGMLCLGFFFQRHGYKKACPIDQRENCERTKSWAGPVLYVSLVINFIGAFYAFLLPRLL